MTLTNLPGPGKSPARIITAGDGPTLIVNRDIVNQVLYGPQSITGANLNQYAVLDPLGSIQVPGDTDIYAVGAAGNPTVDVVSGASGWVASPAQVALQIQALGLATANNQATQITGVGNTNGYLAGTTPGALVSTAGRTNPQETAALLASGNAGGSTGGIPLLRFTSNLGSGAGVNIPAASTITLLTTVGLNQPGYEGVFSVFYVGAAAIPFVKVIVVWTDATTGLTVGQRTFFMSGGNNSSCQYYIHGPVKGNQVSVTIQNLDASQAATITWGFNLTSHIYLVDNIIQTNYPAIPPNGYTNPNGFPNAGILCTATPSILANAQTSRLLAVYSGQAGFLVSNSGSTVLHVYLTDPVSAAGGLYGNAISRYAGFSGNALAAGQAEYVEAALPYGPLLLTITNESTTTTGNVNVGIIGLDY